MDPPPSARLRESYYVYLIPLSIFAAKLLDIIFRIIGIDFASPADSARGWFIANFIEWFGVLYGLLLPLILVRAWEQLDDIDREFDREADAVKVLYEDLFFLSGERATFGKRIAALLHDYVVHVMDKYPSETKRLGDENVDRNTLFVRIRQLYDQLMRPIASGNWEDTTTELDLDETTKPDDPRRTGDEILESIRQEYKSIMRPSVTTDPVSDFLIRELFERLNEVIDIRGDRIGLASQRLFESLRIIALITSIIFVVPFYFVSFISFPSGLLDDTLIVGVTLLAIFIYLIIEDLDDPFTGIWKIDTESWKRVLDEMDSPERIQELENLGKEEPEKNTSVVGDANTQVPDPSEGEDGKVNLNTEGKTITGQPEPHVRRKKSVTKSKDSMLTPAPSKRRLTKK
jgi:hypothetical protein